MNDYAAVRLTVLNLYQGANNFVTIRKQGSTELGETSLTSIRDKRTLLLAASSSE